MGLQRAFHMAGARSVIASLWKVDDDATKTLMVEFYKNLWKEKMGKLAALRKAQLTMIRNYDSKSKKLRAGGLVAEVDPDKLKTAPNSEPRPRRPTAALLLGRLPTQRRLALVRHSYCQVERTRRCSFADRAFGW